MGEKGKTPSWLKGDLPSWIVVGLLSVLGVLGKRTLDTVDDALKTINRHEVRISVLETGFRNQK